MNTDNPVIQLCLLGSKAELQKDLKLAFYYYNQAWNESIDDYDFSISAHYLARVQNNEQDIFKWNEIALRHALKSDNSEINDFFPSLYINMGDSFLKRNDKDQALKYFKKGYELVENAESESFNDMFKNNFIEKIKDLI